MHHVEYRNPRGAYSSAPISMPALLSPMRQSKLDVTQRRLPHRDCCIEVVVHVSKLAKDTNGGLRQCGLVEAECSARCSLCVVVMGAFRIQEETLHAPFDSILR